MSGRLYEHVGDDRLYPRHRIAVQDLLPLLMEALKSAEGGEYPLTPEEWQELDRKPFIKPLLGRRAPPAGDLFYEVVELYLRLRAFQTARVLYDLLVGITVSVKFDVGFSCPFRIGDELMRLPTAK